MADMTEAVSTTGGTRTVSESVDPRRALASTVQVAVAAAIGGYFLALIGVAVLNDIIRTLRTGGSGGTGGLAPAVSATWAQLVSFALAVASSLSSAKAAWRKTQK